ncbi:MAG: hypothetical protein M1832_001215 [Thelocarpon impressellum]|nr:MAG: hypothetical protein M1832_001215 [Thelocarpon impressellum]
MAAVSDPTAALQALASSLAQDDIPIKLRCAICNKLAINAFRLPCCDQSICETCQSSLPAACPVCEHTPLSAEDCKPNKALRTTTKVFLRTEEKKRETLKAKARPEEAPAVPLTPVTSSVAPIERKPNVPDVGTDGLAPGSETHGTAEVRSAEPEATEAPTSGEAQEDIPHPSIEDVDKGQELVESKQQEDDAAAAEASAKQEQKDLEPHAANGSSQLPGQPAGQGHWSGAQGQQQTQMFNAGGFGMDGVGGGFPGMGWNGQAGFDPMMQAMQTGMPNGAWHAFPNMMGMPGTAMDPMAMSQGMYGGFGGQGMGMNGMNMGMGMGFDATQGGYDGWNGTHQAWNGGQDKFNPNARGGLAIGMGDSFGANAGYQTFAGGYNVPPSHGNHKQMQQQQQQPQHQQQYPTNGYQNGFQGQGYFPGGQAGGRGFGQDQAQAYQGHNGPTRQNAAQAPQSQGTQQGKAELGVDGAAAPSETDAKALTSEPTLDAQGGGLETADAKESGERKGDGSATAAPTSTDRPPPAGQSMNPTEGGGSASDPTGSSAAAVADATGMDIQPPLGPAALMHGHQIPGFPGRGRGGMNGLNRGGLAMAGRGAGVWPNANGVGFSAGQAGQSNGFPVAAPTAPRGLGVVGAPKAPKALREGLPNTSMRGRGFAIMGRATAATNGVPDSAAKTKSPSPRRPRSESRPRSREGRASRQRSRSGRRSRSGSGDAGDGERRGSVRRRRSQKDERDQRDDSDGKGDGANGRDSRRASEVNASPRSRSPDPARKSSHAGRRAEEDERAHEHRSSHRPHRDRSRSRDRRHRRRRSRSPSRGRDERDRRRGRRERSVSVHGSEHEHRHARRSRRDDRGREREKEARKEKGRRGATEKDSHTLEREARNRERMLKEQQRRDELTKGRDGMDRDRKRGREADDAAAADVEGVGRGGGGGGGGGEGRSKRRKRKSRHGRRASHRYEEEETHEARALRVEGEREAARWK